MSVSLFISPSVFIWWYIWIRSDIALKSCNFVIKLFSKVGIYFLLLLFKLKFSSFLHPHPMFIQWTSFLTALDRKESQLGKTSQPKLFFSMLLYSNISISVLTFSILVAHTVILIPAIRLLQTYFLTWWSSTFEPKVFILFVLSALQSLALVRV